MPKNGKHAAGAGTEHPLAEAALLAVVFTALAFQPLRFEPFEAEKVGLLGICAAVIAGAGIATWIRHPRHRPAPVRAMRNPLIMAVGALLTTVLISTLFSLSFTRSLWGSAYRSQGLIAFVGYGLIFWQTTRISAKAQAKLGPFLMLTAIPICLLAILASYGLGPADLQAIRPGATTGNANFLAAWLVMVLLYIGPPLCKQLTGLQRPSLPGRAVMPGMTCLLIAFTLTRLGSRGAILGLSAGLLTGGVIIAALRQKRRALLAIVALSIAAGAGYIVISRSTLGGASGLARLFQPYDPVRFAMWKGASGILAEQTAPFHTADGKPDRWAVLRPLVGYGPDTIDQTHSHLVMHAPEIEEIARFESGYAAIVDRFHNLIFDSRAMLGWLGLLAWVGVYEAALYLGLRRLGFMRTQSWRGWLLMQAGGALCGVPLTRLAIPESTLAALTPTGGALGALGGTLVWVGWQAFRQTPAPPLELDARHLRIISIICVVVARWVDNQFGFTLAVTQALWWLMLGMLVRLTDEAAAEPNDDKAGDHAWYRGAMVVGVFLIHSIEAPINSRLIALSNQPLVSLACLLAVVCLTGMLGAWLSHPKGKRRVDWNHATLVVSVWLGFLVAKRVIGAGAAASLDRALASAEGLTVPVLRSACLLLALGGIGAVFIAIVAISAFKGTAGLKRLAWQQVLIAGLCIAVGSAGYALSYTGAALHNVGNALAGAFEATGDPTRFATAELAFEAALSVTPANTQIRIHWIYLLGLDNNSAEAEQIKAQCDAAYRWEPFSPNA